MVAWFAAIIFILTLLPKIGAGTLWHHDELLTANRAREMLVRGDPFAVTVNFVPSVKKPPLQYWLCAGLLWLLPGHPELAVRLPTLLFGAACLLAAAWLARTWFPEDPPLAAWSAVALAGCGYLIHFSRVGLLDTGAALFLTLTLIGYRLARREDTRWWWFVAAMCGLGAWQKAPYGLVAWGILLVTERFYGVDGKARNARIPANRSPHLPAAFVVAILGAVSWWIVQWVRQDPAVLALSSREQLGSFLRAHDPGDQGFRPWLYWKWLICDWAVLGLCAPVAVVAAGWAGKREPGGAQLGWVSAIFGGITACLAYRAERYLVVFTPALAVLTIRFLRPLTGRLPGARRGWLMPLAIASTLPVAAFQYFKPAPDRTDLRAIARELARTQRPGERLLVCTDADPAFEEGNFVLFYANLRRSLEMVTLPEVKILPDRSEPCRGVCNLKQWNQLQQSHPAWRMVAATGDWVLWESGT